jgi:hypothetical protein
MLLKIAVPYSALHDRQYLDVYKLRSNQEEAHHEVCKL